MILGVSMFMTNLNVGVRYLLPLVPLLCIALGRLLADPETRRQVAARDGWSVRSRSHWCCFRVLRWCG